MTTPGRIVLVAGPMYAGKSDHLLRALDRWERLQRRARPYAPPWQPAWAYVPDLPDWPRRIRSRTGRAREALPLTPELLRQAGPGRPHRLVVLDEAQFMPYWLPDWLRGWRGGGGSALVGALDRDFLGRPLPRTWALLRLADRVRWRWATCTRCGAAATHSWRRPQAGTGLVVLDDGTQYEARCARCHEAG